MLGSMVTSMSSFAAVGSHARISDGQVILTEQNHDRPAGTVVATIKTEGSVCILTWLADDRIAGQVDRLQIDHLGVKYDMGIGSGMVSNHVILEVDNWKLPAASLASQFKRWLKEKCDFVVFGYANAESMMLPDRRAG